MTTMTSEEQERIAEIKALVEAATPGEWFVRVSYIYPDTYNVFSPVYDGAVASILSKEDADIVVCAKQGILWLLDMVERQQRVIDCNGDTSDYEISLLKAENTEYRHIAMQAIAAGQILLCLRPEGTPSRVLAESVLNESREKVLALMREADSNENAPKMDNVLDNVLDNKMDNNLDNDSAVKIG